MLGASWRSGYAADCKAALPPKDSNGLGSKNPSDIAKTFRERANAHWALPEKLLARFIDKIDFDGPAHPYRADLPPCWIWTGARRPDGYGQLKVRGRTFAAHRLAWQWENGRDPGDAMVLHSCDNRACVNPAHLRLGTNADNMRDMVERSRGGIALAAEEVVHIIMSPASGASLARFYGVTSTTIYLIRRRRKWQHLHGLLDDLAAALRENAEARTRNPAAGEETGDGAE
jgi:hypothetical protein